MSRCSCGESLGVVAVKRFLDIVYLESLAGRLCGCGVSCRGSSLFVLSLYWFSPGFPLINWAILFFLINR